MEALIYIYIEKDNDIYVKMHIHFLDIYDLKINKNKNNNPIIELSLNS